MVYCATADPADRQEHALDQARGGQAGRFGDTRRRVREGAARGRRVQTAAGRGECVAAYVRAREGEGEVQGVRRRFAM